MPSPAQYGIPRSLRAQTKVINKGLLRIQVSTAEQRRNVALQLQSAGWVQDSQSAQETQMHRPKKLRSADIAAIVYGFFFFIIPAVIYFMMWSSKPIPVIIIEQTIPNTVAG